MKMKIATFLLYTCNEYGVLEVNTNLVMIECTCKLIDFYDRGLG
jgi:hypothetical protein